jgi:hypothetical protein
MEMAMLRSAMLAGVIALSSVAMALPAVAQSRGNHGSFERGGRFEGRGFERRGDFDHRRFGGPFFNFGYGGYPYSYAYPYPYGYSPNYSYYPYYPYGAPGYP